jgi:hypothetical protein
LAGLGGGGYSRRVLPLDEIAPELPRLLTRAEYGRMVAARTGASRIEGVSIAVSDVIRN